MLFLIHSKNKNWISHTKKDVKTNKNDNEQIQNDNRKNYDVNADADT